MPDGHAVDMIVEGATVIDGTGRPGTVLDVATTGSRITAVGDLENIRAVARVDGTGLVVAPGFIDVHSHDDLALLDNPAMECKVSQGVTTVVAGNCGVSAAPLEPFETLPAPFPLLGPADSFRFPTVEHYRDRIDRDPPAVNVALLAGHSSLRLSTMDGSLDRPATTSEIEAMSSRLDESLRAGCIGLSSGLEYPPARSAPIDELVALAEVLAAHDGAIYTTHVRDEGDGVVDAVREALETGRRSEAPLVISHLKCAGPRNHGRSTETLALIDTAARTDPVALDVYPYTAASTMLIPGFVRDADAVLIAWSEPHPEWAGAGLGTIAAAWECSVEAAAARLHPAGAIYFLMDEDDVRRIISHPLSMIGSDGLPGRNRPHPRLWGTFPRVLARYVRDAGVLSLPEAIHKMTGRSAAVLGLSDRGEISVGRAADLVLFDADEIEDTATYDEPETAASGIAMVVVNGEVVWRDGSSTAARPGRFLTRNPV